MQVEVNGDHINDGMTSTLPQLRQNLLCLIRTDIVVRKDLLHVFNSLLDSFFVICTAVLAEKKLQYINWNVCAFLYFLRQVLTHDFAVKVLA